MLLTLLTLAAGLVSLLFGGEILVRGAVALAERARVSPLIVGLVIVGFGTSMPELVASLNAAFAGSTAIAWGNVVGSNIANTLLILGGVAMLAPFAVRQQAAMRDTGIALFSSLALLGIAAAGLGNRFLGLAMLAALGAYVAYCYREERLAPAVHHNAPSDRYAATKLRERDLHVPSAGWGRPIVLTLVGLALLLVGGRLLVLSAIDLATLAGLSETLIGLTVVAVGTALPELVTSLVAARKGHPELAFGNVIGSNLYNILGIGGVIMLAAPDAIPGSLLPFDLGVMTASAVALVALVWFVQSVPRLAGFAFVASYIAFLLVLGARV